MAAERNESIIQSAMYLTGKEHNVPDSVAKYVPPKKRGKKNSAKRQQNEKERTHMAITESPAKQEEFNSQSQASHKAGERGKSRAHTQGGELHLDKRNYRRHNERNKQLINRSLSQFGAGRSILADKNGEVVAGNGVFEQAQQLGIPIRVIETDGSELIAVKRLDLATDDPRRKQLALADNATSDSSEWEYEVLAEDWDDTTLNEWGIEMPEMEEDIEPVAGETEPDAVPEAPMEAASVPGEVYQLGNHRLMCGDSTSAQQVAALMDDTDGDLWLSDPPYNVAYEGKTKDALTIQNDEMSDSNFREFLRQAFDNVHSHMKPGASFYIFHADSEGYNFRGACHDIGLQVRQCLVWKKNSLVMGRQDYQWIHEPCLYGWKDGAAHKWNSDRCQTTVLEFNRPTRNDVHPTMKPVDILAYLIGNSTDRGDVVIDTFGGSGSTLIACEQTGRVCRSMELDPKYADVIRKRWAEFTHGEGCDWQSLTPVISECKDDDAENADND